MKLLFGYGWCYNHGIEEENAMEVHEFIEIYAGLSEDARNQIVSFLRECGRQSDSRESDSDTVHTVPSLLD